MSTPFAIDLYILVKEERVRVRAMAFFAYPLEPETMVFSCIGELRHPFELPALHLHFIPD